MPCKQTRGATVLRGIIDPSAGPNEKTSLQTMALVQAIYEKYFRGGITGHGIAFLGLGTGSPVWSGRVVPRGAGGFLVPALCRRRFLFRLKSDRRLSARETTLGL